MSKPTASMKMEVIGSINLVPTWRGLLPVLVELASNGTTVESRLYAMSELYRLADLADAHNLKTKEQK